MGDEKKIVYEDVVACSSGKLQWIDVSNELWRKYKYPNGTIERYESPVALVIGSKHRHWGGGGHRLVTADGLSHYVPPGWTRLTWQGLKGLAYDW